MTVQRMEPIAGYLSMPMRLAQVSSVMMPFLKASSSVESVASSTFSSAEMEPPSRTTLPWSSPMPSVVPPGASMKPVMAMSAMRHWPSWVPFGFSSTARPQATLLGLALPYRRAARQICSSGTPQISAAFAGGMSCTRSTSCS